MATKFQEQVWKKLTQIPLGRVTTYGEIARSLGKPRASRAVGSACGANPELVTVPCHRVVTSDGLVGQYAGGVAKKVSLLEQEGIRIDNGNIIDFEEKKYIF